MYYVRIKSYSPDGTFTGCEHLYFGSNHVKALEWFRREYPEHKDCIVSAETIDSESAENREYFAVCKRCGCVHPF